MVLNKRIYLTSIIEDAVNAKIIGNCKLVNSDTVEGEDEGDNRVEE